MKIYILYILFILLSTSLEAQENPLLAFFDTPFHVPPFDKIKVDDYLPAFEAAIDEHNSEIEAIIVNEDRPAFKNTIAALDFSGERLTAIKHIFFNLKSAFTNDEMQKIAKKVSPMLSRHDDEIILNADLFARVKAVYDRCDQLDLTTEQKTVLDKIYKDFVRNGANLSADEKEKLKAINEEMTLATLQFGDNVLAETNDFQLIIDKKEDLAGLPQWLIDSAAEAAERAGKKDFWVFTLHKPSWIPFLQYSENRKLREKLYKAVMQRGDNNNKNDNKALINEIVNLRIQRAQLLGYETHADYVLERNMAQKPKAVYELLNKLWDAALTVAKQEASDMQDMIDRQGGDFQLQPWDWWFYAEKVRQEKYALSEEKLKPYFSLKNVRDGVFDVAGKLYGLRFIQRHDVPVYHKDVEAWEVRDADDSFLGVLYMDYYTRPSKSGGAWCTIYRKQVRKNGKRIAPIVSIVTNFQQPTKEMPSLLSYDNVLTFFHEFGHALHNLLSDGTYPRVTCTSVARDFVELPSQIMENWAAEPEVLKFYARHYKTDEPIPPEFVDKLQKSQHFNQGFKTVEYLAASFLDMDYHTLRKPAKISANEFEQKSMNCIGLIDEIIPRYRSTYFLHIFAGGYSSGYYSYIWAEVLDADAFEAFKQAGLFDQQTATSFRDHILSRGSSEKEMTLYKRFRGKEPKIEPLLERRGLN